MVIQLKREKVKDWIKQRKKSISLNSDFIYDGDSYDVFRNKLRYESRKVRYQNDSAFRKALEEYTKRYWQKNPEKLKEYHKKYYETNKERIKKYYSEKPGTNSYIKENQRGKNMESKDLFLNNEEINKIFKEHLKVESTLQSIEGLFANARRFDKIDFSPYYQRNYVWDKNKSSYFIESILLGTEIPPLIFFDNGKKIEVIDGRQRFETIHRFKSNEFALTKKGLLALTTLYNKKFKDLPVELRDKFYDTKIRIIQFTIVNEPKLDDINEDLIKKEIFRRYNSGISPLKEFEIDHAKYYDEDVTRAFKNYFNKHQSDYKNAITLFLGQYETDKITASTFEKLMKKIRIALVLHNIPINYYATLKGRNDIINYLYENKISILEDVDNLIANFINKQNILMQLYNKLADKQYINNRLIYECLFWLLNISDIEGIPISKINLLNDTDALADKIQQNKEIFSTQNSLFRQSVLDRYMFILDLLPKNTNIDKSIYLTNSKKFKADYDNDIDVDDLQKELRTHCVFKSGVVTTTIVDILTQIERSKYLIRPSYQRQEVINLRKSSDLIESILLGIPLPPIFIYTRDDGISEVVDGQQRLLTILGFMSKSFKDNLGNDVRSSKDNFKLKKLRILKELEGKRFSELPEVYSNKIYDYNISVITIDGKVNPYFEATDLFIRLNNKPYPVKEDTFEMWNSYIYKEVIKKIKDNTNKHNSWFFLRVPAADKRMINEQLYTTLAYLYFKLNTQELTDFLDIIIRDKRINLRVKNKSDITKTLNDVTADEKIRLKFMCSISDLEKFIKKLKILLIREDSDHFSEIDDDLLKTELNELMQIEGLSRRMTNLYILWALLNSVNYERIKIDAPQINTEIKQIFADLKNISEDENPIDFFLNIIDYLNTKYQKDKRKINLSDDQKIKILENQEKKCPICGGYLNKLHDIEVDHIMPLAIGGKEDISNLQIVHMDCNRHKWCKQKSIKSL